MISSTIIKGIKKGIVALTTRSKLKFVRLDIIYRHGPTGGVNNPIIKLRTKITPK